MIIYKATNLINGKVYIGQTVRTLNERMKEHLRHNKTAFDKALQKYGISNFDIEIIDTAQTIEELNEKEKYWIIQCNAFGKCGYNMCEGGGNTKGFHHKQETREKMRKLKIDKYNGENNPFYGKHHSEETKKQFSKIRSGRLLTDEWKEHISENSGKRKKVRNIETGEIFNSLKEAAEKYNIIPTHITRVCRGKRKTTGGYHWEYVS